MASPRLDEANKKFCEDCGEQMHAENTESFGREWICVNPDCPSWKEYADG